MFDTLQAFLKIAADFKAPVERDSSKMYVSSVGKRWAYWPGQRCSILCG